MGFLLHCNIIRLPGFGCMLVADVKTRSHVNSVIEEKYGKDVVFDGTGKLYLKYMTVRRIYADF